MGLVYFFNSQVLEMEIYIISLLAFHHFFSSLLWSSPWQNVTHRRNNLFWLMTWNALYHRLEILEGILSHSYCGTSLIIYYWIRKQRNETVSDLLTSNFTHHMWCCNVCLALVFSPQVNLLEPPKKRHQQVCLLHDSKSSHI